MEKLVPILFSTAMVTAILNDSKTKTRRIVNPQPIIDPESGFVFDGKHRQSYKHDILHADWKIKFQEDWCKYHVGDILWVRETFCKSANGKLYFYKADQIYPDGKGDKVGRPIDYEKDGGVEWSGTTWKPAIHMPFSACRLFLKIKSVRIERLQDITDGDVHAEGITWNEPLQFKRDQKGCNSPAQRAFKELWDKINGTRASWQDNPFVWIVEFEKCNNPKK